MKRGGSGSACRQRLRRGPAAEGLSLGTRVFANLTTLCGGGHARDAFYTIFVDICVVIASQIAPLGRNGRILLRISSYIFVFVALAPFGRILSPVEKSRKTNNCPSYARDKLRRVTACACVASGGRHLGPKEL